MTEYSLWTVFDAVAIAVPERVPRPFRSDARRGARRPLRSRPALMHNTAPPRRRPDGGELDAVPGAGFRSAVG